eukprot:gnl/TRDRNA2_/TRDRNA2_118243_c1_seq1.p1 gnl/TRDRNA2_/TRDRNA2_118243_c1~~gnl/TRDRNA2_/TRDRNA2_118243_c1_seq1.p1  ORF type:complete len:154 (-),score=24.21 gnl/TRDRNA2_/TRDRNA2_118243_c1_seq1:8-409(-)
MADQHFGSCARLCEAEKAVAPLLKLLDAPENDLAEDHLLMLERITSLVLEREYKAANQAYIELTVGKGTWHNSMKVCITGCAKQPRGGMHTVKKGTSFLDTEGAKEYMFCLKRLVALSQLIRPNDDISKHSIR